MVKWPWPAKCSFNGNWGQSRSSSRICHGVSTCCAIEGVIPRKAAIGNCLASLLTNHSHTVMVLAVKPANANPVFRALADPTRRAIFEELTRQGEQTVHALTRYAGVSQPAVSKHLTVLKRAKLVRHRREGRETHYRARPDALAPMVDWLSLKTY
jgi:DNA-binding transcriptional ArsR family regulator